MLTIEIDTEGRWDLPVQVALGNAVQLSLDLLLARVTQYPPPPPNSTYVRGGPGSQNLGQKWTVQVERFSDGVEGIIGNNVTYGPYVQSRDMQAWMHQGRWDTIEDIAEDELDMIGRIFAMELGRL